MNSHMTEILEGRIDFVGQQWAERVSRIVLAAATIISFVAGFAAQSLSVTFGIFAAATVLLALSVVPPWPIMNRHPVTWLPLKTDPAKQK